MYIAYIDRDFNSLYTDQKFKQFHQDLAETWRKQKGYTFELQFLVCDLQFVVAIHLGC